MGQDVIELNGKRYDAITGAYLGKSSVIPKHIVERHINGRVVDGFVRPPSHTKHRPKPQPDVSKRPSARPSESEHQASTPKDGRAKPFHTKPHQPERSKTLMRRVIKKPEFSLKPAIKPQAPAEMMARPMSEITHKRSAYGIDPSRKERAGLVGRHQAVRHFGNPATHSVASHVPVIPVRSTPLHAMARPQIVPPRPHADIFERAIAHASSHEQPMHKVRKHRTRRRKLANTIAIVAAFLVIGGFVSYLNLPQLQLRVASVQTGFGASMPAYTPTGYALENGVKRSGGTVSLSFRSGDSRFAITQQSSNWNSQTLLDNTLALNGRHETVQKNGQTVYIYENGGTNASWVNGGVRYDLTGNAQLSTDEIVSIATSL